MHEYFQKCFFIDAPKETKEDQTDKHHQLKFIVIET